MAHQKNYIISRVTRDNSIVMSSCLIIKKVKREKIVSLAKFEFLVILDQLAINIGE